MRWRIYFDDGTTRDGTDAADVAGVRGDGVICIIQTDTEHGDVYAVGRELLCDQDFYCWRESDTRWFRCDRYGMEDYLRQPGWKKVIAGRTVERSTYRAVMLLAMQDPEFPPKSAWQPGEMRAKAIVDG